jgi:hypothetical protein
MIGVEGRQLEKSGPPHEAPRLHMSSFVKRSVKHIICFRKGCQIEQKTAWRYQDQE